MLTQSSHDVYQWDALLIKSEKEAKRKNWKREYGIGRNEKTKDRENKLSDSITFRCFTVLYYSGTTTTWIIHRIRTTKLYVYFKIFFAAKKATENIQLACHWPDYQTAWGQPLITVFSNGKEKHIKMCYQLQTVLIVVPKALSLVGVTSPTKYLVQLFLYTINYVSITKGR